MEEESSNAEQAAEAEFALLRRRLQACHLKVDYHLHRDFLTTPAEFVWATRGNETVKTVEWCSHPTEITFDWDSLGEGLGNLENLQKVSIHSIFNWQRFQLYWEPVGVVLPYMKQKGLELEIDCEFVFQQERPLLPDETTAVMEAFRGHPTIEKITCFNLGPFGWFLEMMTALASLPSLREVSLQRKQGGRGPLEDPGSLTVLLQLASLRKLSLKGFSFAAGDCDALAAGIRNAPAIQELSLTQCAFRTPNAHVVAQALGENTTLTKITYVENHLSEAFFRSLAGAIRCRATIAHLDLQTDWSDECVWLAPVFEALGTNTTLKTLHVDNIVLIDPLLSQAIRVGLSKNSTLERVKLRGGAGLPDEDVRAWSAILPFLRDNASLKSVHIEFGGTGRKLYEDALSMLADQTVLEELALSAFIEKLDITEYCNILQRLHPNKSLKRLCIGDIIVPDSSDDDAVAIFNAEKERLVSILIENYYLQELILRENSSLEELEREEDSGHGKAVDVVLTLNKAGRRYLVEDASSSRKGVAVLSAVRNDLDCIYFHLLENPALCIIDHEEIGSKCTSRPQKRPRRLS